METVTIEKEKLQQIHKTADKKTKVKMEAAYGKEIFMPKPKPLIPSKQQQRADTLKRLRKLADKQERVKKTK